MEQKPKVVRDIVLTCVVLLRTHRGGGGGADSSPTPANEQVVYVPDDNYRNPSRETKYQEDRIWNGSYPGAEEAGIY